MRTIITIIFWFCIICPYNAFSQNDDSSDNNNNKQVVFVGFDTGTSDNFIEIYETLIRTKGITVLSYCERNKIIKLSFNKEYYKELSLIFEYIESMFDDTICYNKKYYTDESYNKMCYSELAKKTMGEIK